MESYTCTEYVNVTNLNKILKANKIDEDTIKYLKRLKTHVKDTGSHKIEFVPMEKISKTESIGRLYPKHKHPSVQGLKREVRKALCYDKCMDLDLKNAHPNILYQLLQKHKIDCKALKYYIDNRDTVLELYDDRDHGKERYCTLMNGGKPKKDSPDFETEYYEEVLEATSRLFELSKYSRYLDIGKIKKPTNSHGNAVSMLLQDHERKVMTCVIEKLKDLNYETSTIIHDGLLIKTQTILPSHIRDIEEYIKDQTHFELNLSVKPMNDFDEELLWDTDTSTETDDEPNDADEAKKFLEYMNNLGHHFVRSGDNFFWYKPEEGVWTERTTIKEFRNYMLECPVLTQLYAKSARKQDNLFTMFLAIVPSDPYFTANAFKTTYRKLPFNNGVWDFQTETLLPFSKDFRFFGKLKWDWGDLDLQLKDEILQRVIYGSFGEVRGDYYLDIVSRAIAGEVYDKVFTVVIGEGNSGKGVNQDLLKYSFGDDFVGNFNAGQLCKKFNVIDEAKAKSWMISIANKRIAYCSEIPQGSPLDQGAIKSLASGGDDITGRRNFKDEVTFKLECTPIAFLNDIPEIKGCDPAISNRMRYIETQYVYLPEETYHEAPHVRRADPEIKNSFINREDVLRTFAIMVCLNYKKQVPIAPKEVLIASKEWLASDDITERIKELFDVSDNPEDYVSSKQFITAVGQSGVEASSTRIGRIMTSLGFKSVVKKVSGKTVKVYHGISLIRGTGDF